jgi:hypothetical protein
VIRAYAASANLATIREAQIAEAMRAHVAAEGHVAAPPKHMRARPPFDAEHRRRSAVARGIARGDAPEAIAKFSRIRIYDVRRIIAEFEAGAPIPTITRDRSKRA